MASECRLLGPPRRLDHERIGFHPDKSFAEVERRKVCDDLEGKFVKQHDYCDSADRSDRDNNRCLVKSRYLAFRYGWNTNASYFIPTNLLRKLNAGMFAMIWKGNSSNSLITVIAQPDRIETITDWIHEHDSHTH